jgi:hypothetical protein
MSGANSEVDYSQQGAKPPLFNMSINLGSILTIISMLLSVTVAYGAISSRIAVLEIEIQHLPAIEQKVDMVDTKVTDLAYQEGRQEQKLEDER